MGQQLPPRHRLAWKCNADCLGGPGKHQSGREDAEPDTFDVQLPDDWPPSLMARSTNRRRATPRFFHWQNLDLKDRLLPNRHAQSDQ